MSNVGVRYLCFGYDAGGGATGTVSVVTPAGTLNSNPQFVVAK
jgi:hypothetical protein